MSSPRRSQRHKPWRRWSPPLGLAIWTRLDPQTCSKNIKTLFRQLFPLHWNTQIKIIPVWSNTTVSPPSEGLHASKQTEKIAAYSTSSPGTRRTKRNPLYTCRSKFHSKSGNKLEGQHVQDWADELIWKGSLHEKRDESVVSDYFGEEYGLADKNIEVANQGFSVEEIVWSNQEVPATNHITTNVSIGRLANDKIWEKRQTTYHERDLNQGKLWTRYTA